MPGPPTTMLDVMPVFAASPLSHPVDHMETNSHLWIYLRSSAMSSAVPAFVTLESEQRMRGFAVWTVTGAVAVSVKYSRTGWEEDRGC